MSGFVLHHEAYADLDDVWEHIAAHNPDAADRVIEEIFESIRRLPSFPDQGHVRPDLTSRLVRFQRVRDFLIAYAPQEQPLLILAIVHGRRSPRLIAALLRQRR